jgi:hypothetical protein
MHLEYGSRAAIWEAWAEICRNVRELQHQSDATLMGRRVSDFISRGMGFWGCGPGISSSVWENKTTG